MAFFLQKYFGIYSYRTLIKNLTNLSNLTTGNGGIAGSYFGYMATEAIIDASVNYGTMDQNQSAGILCSLGNNSQLFESNDKYDIRLVNCKNYGYINGSLNAGIHFFKDKMLYKIDNCINLVKISGTSCCGIAIVGGSEQVNFDYPELTNSYINVINCYSISNYTSTAFFAYINASTSVSSSTIVVKNLPLNILFDNCYSVNTNLSARNRLIYISADYKIPNIDPNRPGQTKSTTINNGVISNIYSVYSTLSQSQFKPEIKLQNTFDGDTTWNDANALLYLTQFPWLSAIPNKPYVLLNFRPPLTPAIYENFPTNGTLSPIPAYSAKYPAKYYYINQSEPNLLINSATGTITNIVSKNNIVANICHFINSSLSEYHIFILELNTIPGPEITPLPPTNNYFAYIEQNYVTPDFNYLEIFRNYDPNTTHSTLILQSVNTNRKNISITQTIKEGLNFNNF